MTDPVSLHHAEQTLEAAQPKRYAAYPAYRSSGVDWLGDIPLDWEVKRLKYVTSINDETLLETTDPAYEFSYVDIGNVSSAKGIVAKEPQVFEDAPSRARRIVRDGDTIVSTVRTYLRAIAPVREAGNHLIVSTGFAVVRPRKINPDYLSFVLRSSYFVETVVSRSTGVSYPAINASEIGQIPVPLPSPDEQQVIARFLDEQTKKIDDLIEAKRDLLALLKEKRQAVITHAVTKGLNPDARLKPSGIDWLGDVPEHWRIVLLRRLISEMRNGTSTNQDVESEHSVPVTRIETISNGFINFAKVGYVEYDKALEPYRLQRGDILMSHINSLPMIGNCAFYDSDKVLFNGMNVLRIQPQSDVHSEWLWQTLASNLYRQAIRAIAKPAINQASVTTTQIKQLQIPLPPHDEQQAIAQFLREQTTKIDAVITEASAAITQLTEYRTALISAAVTGKIDVRGGAV